MIPEGPGNNLYAAGAICWRVINNQLEVLLVHRPEYDDWSWPKGMNEDTESLHVTAIREVLEETGLHITLGRPLPGTSYPLGRFQKYVSYWAAHVPDIELPKPPRPHEVDETRWFPWEKARTKLTQAGDRAPGDALAALFDSDTLKTRPVIVAKHGFAYPPEAWKERAEKRPLVKAGGRQARRLALYLQAWQPTEVWAGKNVRCRQTAKPYLKTRKTKTYLKHKLACETPECDPKELKKIAQKISTSTHNTLVCATDSSAIALLSALASHSPQVDSSDWPDCFMSDPGSAIVLHLHTHAGHVLETETISISPGK